MLKKTFKLSVYMVFVLGAFFYFSGVALGEHVVTGEPNVSVVTHADNYTADITIEASAFINGELNNHSLGESGELIELDENLGPVEGDEVLIRWDVTCTKGLPLTKISTITNGNVTSQTITCSYAVALNDNIAEIAVDISPPIDEIKFKEITFTVPKAATMSVTAPVSTDGGAPYTVGENRTFSSTFTWTGFPPGLYRASFVKGGIVLAISPFISLSTSPETVEFSYTFASAGSDWQVCAFGTAVSPQVTKTVCTDITVVDPALPDVNLDVKKTGTPDNNFGSSIGIDLSDTVHLRWSSNGAESGSCRKLADRSGSDWSTSPQAVDDNGEDAAVSFSSAGTYILKVTCNPALAFEYKIIETANAAHDGTGHDEVIIIVAGPGVNLVVDSTSASPSPAEPNQTIGFVGNIKNTGGEAAAASTARLRIDENNNGSWEFTDTRATAGLSPDSTTTVNFSWSTSNAGSHKYEICADSTNVVTEANEADNCSEAIFVVAAAGNPVANAGPAHALTTGIARTHFGATATDPDGNLASYTWELTARPSGSSAALVAGSETGSLSGGSAILAASPTYTPDLDGNYTIELTVFDGDGNTGTAAVTETASTVLSNDPAANAGPSHAISVNVPHLHSGGSATDSDGNLASYEWDLVSCPAGCPSLIGDIGPISGGSASVPGPTYTPNVAGNYTLQLTVFDDDGNTGVSTVVEAAGGGPSLPDLRASGIPLGIKVTGKTIRFIGSVYNAGSNAPPDSTCVWRFRLDENSDGSWDTEKTLNVCIPSAFHFIGWNPYNWTARPGTHTWEFDVDINNTVVESNEINNHTEGSFTVSSGSGPVVILSVRDSNGIIQDGQWTDSLSGPSPITADIRAEFYDGTGEPVNFTFYCDRNDSSTNITLPFDAQILNVNESSQIVSELCKYQHSLSYGFTSYRPKVVIEQGDDAYQDRESAVVTPSLNKSPIAEAGISLDGVIYSQDISVFRGVPTDVWLSADQDVVQNKPFIVDGLGSFDFYVDPLNPAYPTSDGWDHPVYGVSNGGFCRWNSDFSRGFPTSYETTINNPASASACNISLSGVVFNDSPGTYIYDSILHISDNQGAGSQNSYYYEYPVIPARVSITVEEISGPFATSLSVADGPACVIPLQPTLSWEFTSPNQGEAQDAYNIQVRVDGTSGWGTTKVNTGKIDSSSESFTIPGGALEFNENYNWRAKVWGELGGSSPWINGPDFSTQVHASPDPDFTWLPSSPAVGGEASFTDASTFFDGGSGTREWSWLFSDGTPSSSSAQNPSASFTPKGSKDVILSVRDGDGLQCSVTKAIDVGLEAPSFKEIR